MAKKVHKGEQELPFVALMDTMTNVVGVLTIVLVMMGISLGRAASRVFSSLPPATEAQVRAAQAVLDRTLAEQAPLKEKLKKLADLERDPAKLAALDAELARLQRELEEKKLKLVDLDAANQERNKRDAELKQQKAVTDKLMIERDRAKALLDETPVPKAPPAKIVKIPASRPIPEGAKIEHILVTKDGAYWINLKGAKAYFLNAFKSPSLRPMIQTEVKRGKKTVEIYNYEKLARYLEKQKLAYHDFRVDVLWVDWSASPVLRLVPEGPSSESLRDTLLEFKRVPKTVVLFHVTGDGFETYLAARKVCDPIGVPAGWEYSGGPEYTIHVPELETTKPPVPSKPASPSTTVEIKPPPQKLD
jgi:hypothetical protein